MRAALNDAERRVVAIRGPAGAGKTALAGAALSAAVADGAFAGRGAYREHGEQASFGPILNAFSEVLAAALESPLEPEPVVEDLMRTLGAAAEVLRRAGLAGVPPGPSGVVIAPMDRRGGVLLLTDAMLQLVQWLQGFGRPLVVLIDDWRRGGADAEMLLATLVEEDGALTLLLTESEDAPPVALAEPEHVWSLDLRGARWSDGPQAADRTAPSARRAPKRPRLTVGARQMATALALLGEPVQRSVLTRVLGLSAQAADRDLARLTQAGLVAATDTMTQVVGARRDELLEDLDVEAAAGTLADRIVAAGPEADNRALDLRLMSGLETADPEVWRDRFAVGAAEARARLDPAGARRFAEAAWRLRQRARPKDVASERLILREAMWAAADARSPEDADARARLLIGYAQNHVELGIDHALAIDALRSAGDPERAWRLACEGLARFGVVVPDRIRPWRLALAALLWRRRRSDAADGGTTGSMDGLPYLAQAAATLGFERDPAVSALITFQSARRLRRGADTAAFWMSVDAFLSAIVGDFGEAARLGRETLDHLTPATPFRAATLYRAHFFGEIWVEPLATLRGHAATIHQLAMLEGEITYAATAVRNGVLIGWRTAASLAELREDVIAAERELRRLGDPKILAHATLQRRVIDGLMRWEGAPMVPADDPALALEPLLALEMASLNGDWPLAAALGRRFAPMRRNADSHPGGVVWRFHEALARLKTGARPRRADLAFIERAAALNPADHRPKLMILRSEALHASGDLAASLAGYAEAVEAAEAADSRLEAGVAAECAAAVARDAGQLDLATAYERRAQRTWRAWGAAAKTPADPALEAAAAQLIAAQREGRARSRLLAEVSHELRTPLQGMQGLLDMAAGGDAALDVAAFRDMFGSLKRVVDDLTDFGALASGGVGLASGPVRIGELVRAEASGFAALAEREGGRIDVRLGADLPTVVETDGARVRQVLRNLLSNACKYGAGAPVAVSVAWAADRASVVVEDGGLGFSEADLRLVFEPFQRGAHSGDGQGLGLGLALSRRIAQQLGGGLAAENRTEGGARFIFDFPAPAYEARSEAASPRRALRLLVCEDVPLVREVVCANLRRAGHEVTGLADGAAAWQAWRDSDFDAAILDWNLPGLGGPALIERLEGAPVLVLTASSDVAIEQQALAAGARRVLRKPVSAAELAEAVDTLVGAHAGEPVADHAAFEGEMAALQRAADTQLASDAQSLLARWRAGEPIPEAAFHRLAGLAAQFGHEPLAAAADSVEASLRANDGAIEAAMERFAEAAGQSGAETPSSR